LTILLENLESIRAPLARNWKLSTPITGYYSGENSGWSVVEKIYRKTAKKP
jgi:hypothetical protein